MSAFTISTRIGMILNYATCWHNDPKAEVEAGEDE
jgi:hypothetical protein